MFEMFLQVARTTRDIWQPPDPNRPDPNRPDPTRPERFPTPPGPTRLDPPIFDCLLTHPMGRVMTRQKALVTRIRGHKTGTPPSLHYGKTPSFLIPRRVQHSRCDTYRHTSARPKRLWHTEQEENKTSEHVNVQTRAAIERRTTFFFLQGSLLEEL